MKANLRPLETSDLDNMMTWVNDSEIIGNFANFNHPISREEEAKFLENILASDKDKSFAIETEKGVYLGNGGIHQIHWPSRNGRLSLIIGNKDYWNQGYGKSAINGLLDLAFNQYNLHKVWLLSFESNKKNIHIYNKLGFQKEGIMREEYFHKGKYHNMVKMSMLENEYRGANK